MKKTKTILSFALLVLGAMTACRPQVTLQASKSQIKQGESAELAWTSKNAKTVTINGEPVAPDGTKTVTPEKTTNYEAIARRGEQTARAFARVDVEHVFPKPTLTLNADRPAIERGQNTNLRWSSTSADSVEISGLGSLGPSGSRSVSPTASTTYDGVARGRGGEATASVRVTVTEPPPPPLADTEPPKTTTRKIAAEFSSAVATIPFEFDSSALDDDSQSKLRRTADWLNRPENRSIRFRIEGNCDERGTDEYNLALGDRRANAARDFLIGLGVGAERIETVSYGESHPVDPGSNEEAWAKNRRDDFVYLVGGSSSASR